MTSATTRPAQEKPGKSPVKFLFDDEFGTDGRGKRSRLTVAEHETMLASAQEESFRKGFAAAKAEMQAADQHRIAAASEKIADAMEMIAHQLLSLEQRLEAEAVEVAVSVARKLAPALIEREPLAEIERLVIDVFGELRSAPHVAVRLPKQLVDEASAHLLRLADERGYTGARSIARSRSRSRRLPHRMGRRRRAPRPRCHRKPYRRGGEPLSRPQGTHRSFGE